MSMIGSADIADAVAYVIGVAQEAALVAEAQPDCLVEKQLAGSLQSSREVLNYFAHCSTGFCQIVFIVFAYSMGHGRSCAL
jgi:hypothetical protein